MYLIPGITSSLTAATFNGREVAVAYIERRFSGVPAGDSVEFRELGDGAVHLVHLDPTSGLATRPDVAVAPSGVPPEASVEGQGVTALVWNGTEYAIGWSTSTIPGSYSGRRSYIARVDRDGALIGTPVELPRVSLDVRLVWTGTEYYVGWFEPATDEYFVRRMSASLAPLGEPVSLGTAVYSQGPTHDVAAWSGRRLAVVLQDRRDEGRNYRVRSRIVIVEGDAVVGTTPFPDGPIVTWPSDGDVMGVETPAVVWSGESFVACWSVVEDFTDTGLQRAIYCAFYDEGGAPTGPPFLAAPASFRGAWGADDIELEPASGCSVYLATGWFTISPGWQFDIREVDSGGRSGILATQVLAAGADPKSLALVLTPTGPLTVIPGPQIRAGDDPTLLGQHLVTRLVERTACE
jgi:hypothetical protein